MKKMFEIYSEFARISLGGAIGRMNSMRLGNGQSGLSIATPVKLDILYYILFLVACFSDLKMF